MTAKLMLLKTKGYDHVGHYSHFYDIRVQDPRDSQIIQRETLQPFEKITQRSVFLSFSLLSSHSVSKHQYGDRENAYLKALQWDFPKQWVMS